MRDFRMITIEEIRIGERICYITDLKHRMPKILLVMIDRDSFIVRTSLRIEEHRLLIGWKDHLIEEKGCLMEDKRCHMEDRRCLMEDKRCLLEDKRCLMEDKRCLMEEKRCLMDEKECPMEEKECLMEEKECPMDCLLYTSPSPRDS